MTRKEFNQRCLTMGIGLPFLPFLFEACSSEIIPPPKFEINFSGKVLIVGAGAAGLTAAYLLNRNNIEVQIIEASSVYGGRVKRTDDFADFPIDLGAEWIHVEPSILAEILSDPSVKSSIDIITYNPQTVYNWNNGKLKRQNWASNFYSEYKFKSTTWYGFFEKYIVPHILEKIIFSQPVNEIDYSGDKIAVKTSLDNTFEADKVLITTPVKILQDNFIQFNPALPNDKTEAINSIKMGDGIKVFIEFKERFYPDIVLFGGLIKALTSDSKTYYDAAFRKEANKHILGLFAINENATPYTSLNTEQEIIDKVLKELDEIFEGKASTHYVKHIIQNWSKEIYIGGSYSSDFSGDRTETMNTIATPINNRIYFAGEALSDDNQATVHGACESAYSMVGKILKD